MRKSTAKAASPRAAPFSKCSAVSGSRRTSACASATIRATTSRAPAPAHVKAASLQEFFSTFELDWDAHRTVIARARRHGLAVMTTPFAEEVVPTLQSLQFDAYKIASGDVTYDGLITAVADTGRPMVISSGMSNLEEVGRALRVARRGGADQIAVLQCVSAYPAPLEAQNLRAIR